MTSAERATSTVYVDLETGGLGPEHPIIQIAAVAVAPDWREIGSWEAKLQFREEDCEAKALEINGYTPERWAGADKPYDAARSFARWLDVYRYLPLTSRAGTIYYVAQIAGYNAETFDGPRLKGMFSSLGVFLGGHPRVLDVKQLAMWRLRDAEGLASFRLADVAAWLGIAAPVAHEALADVRTTVAVARALLSEMPAFRREEVSA